MSASDARDPAGFADAGYAVLEGFLDSSSVPTLGREINRALKAPAMTGCNRPHNRLVDVRWNDPIVALALRDPRRREELAHLTEASDLRWISGYVTVKDPQSAPLPWHQDWWCWDHPLSWRRATAQVAVLCYLTDTDARTGALRVIPGSHRRSHPLHRVLPDAHEHGDLVPVDHPAMTDHPDQTTVAVHAGDAIVLDYRLLHGTHPNESARRRDCVLLSRSYPHGASFRPTFAAISSSTRRCRTTTSA